MGSTETGQKPLILAIAGAAVGHFVPALQICQHLVSKGYDVSILQASYFKDSIESIGATFIPLDDECDFCQYDIALKGSPNGRFPERLTLAPGLETLAFDLEHVFMPYIPSQARSISRALEQTRLRDPKRKVVILAENSMLGIVPLRLVSEEKRREVPPVLGLNVVPLTWESIDVGPFGTGLPPDSTPSGRARNIVLHGLVRNFALKGALRALRKYLIDAGADPEYIPGQGELGFNITYDPRVYDKVFQMCLPEVEFPRSDLPGHIQFVGGLPRKPIPANYEYPPWWNDVVANAKLPIGERKRLVVVAQGTFANDFNDLILPTIQGLGARPGFLTVAILGKKGATLQTDLPPNARVADYLPYDAVLPYADVFVQAGSYGGFQHGLVNAVPAVLAGDTEDKPEIAARAEWAQVGLSLKTGHPTPDQVAQGVDEVLADPKYKARCVELSKLMKATDPLDTIENELLLMAASS
ncbi:MGT family Glycosyltransferase [Diaporthe helianthi]|uniref:MGT family Glycosyltransferase n=1 Tax=Diaporthe helianthi TaxID=158607 RepID=A0A2P5IF84_DIAHE|nr:MGT family Glycosyltransferase [Diaporthe helianthi]